MKGKQRPRARMPGAFSRGVRHGSDGECSRTPGDRGLLAEAVAQGRHGQGGVGCRHLRSGVRARRSDGFVLGIPDGVQRGPSCLAACGCVRRPPFAKRLESALGMAAAADPERRAPDGCLCR